MSRCVSPLSAQTRIRREPASSARPLVGLSYTKRRCDVRIFVAGSNRPEKSQEETQTTPKGVEIPVPKREDVLRDLGKLANPPPAPTSPTESRSPRAPRRQARP